MSPRRSLAAELLDLELPIRHVLGYASALMLMSASSPYEDIDSGAVYVVANDLERTAGELQERWKAVLERARTERP